MCCLRNKVHSDLINYVIQSVDTSRQHSDVARLRQNLRCSNLTQLALFITAYIVPTCIVNIGKVHHPIYRVVFFYQRLQSI